MLGGGIANTCLGSKGLEIGRSLAEPSLYSEARNLIEKDNVLLPDKVVVAPNKESEPREVSVEKFKKKSVYLIYHPFTLIQSRRLLQRQKPLSGMALWVSLKRINFL